MNPVADMPTPQPLQLAIEDFERAAYDCFDARASDAKGRTWKAYLAASRHLVRLWDRLSTEAHKYPLQIPPLHLRNLDERMHKLHDALADIAMVRQVPTREISRLARELKRDAAKFEERMEHGH